MTPLYVFLYTKNIVVQTKPINNSRFALVCLSMPFNDVYFESNELTSCCFHKWNIFRLCSLLIQISNADWCKRALVCTHIRKQCAVCNHICRLPFYSLSSDETSTTETLSKSKYSPAHPFNKLSPGRWQVTLPKKNISKSTIVNALSWGWGRVRQLF